MRRKRVDRLTATAYHEAGHAVAAYVQRQGFGYVSIKPGENSLGHVKNRCFGDNFRPDVEVTLGTRERLEKAIVTLLAGGVAEAQLLEGRVPKEEVASSDFSTAIKYLDFLCANNEEVEAYIAWLRVRATNLVKLPRHWRAIQVLAEALLERRTIGHRKVRELLNQVLRTPLPGGQATRAKNDVIPPPP